MWILNAFAFRATNPAELRQAAGPVGLDNDAYLRGTVPDEDLVKGARQARQLRGRDQEMRRLLTVLRYVGTGEPVRLYCLGTTKKAQPMHPLLVPMSEPLVPLAA